MTAVAPNDAIVNVLIGIWMSRLTLALDQITLVRDYTNELIKDVPESEWYRIPSGGVSHIAWQVGHIAMAQYRLALERLRGRTIEDAVLISDDFLNRFGRGSVPETDPTKALPVAEIRAVFNGVYRTVLGELSVFPETDLDSPVLKPHKLVKTKIWSLLYSAQHEMLHAGQIGLLRRELGHAPMW
jgi:hypothetical protein